MKWSSHYFAEGNILIPLAGVNEPFKAWLDLESKMSRIEYYDGNLPRVCLIHLTVINISYCN